MHRFGVHSAADTKQAGTSNEQNTYDDMYATLQEVRTALALPHTTNVAVSKPIAGWKQAMAELIGTGALCFIGILVLTAGGPALFANGTKDLVAIALAHGFTIAVMVSATMSVSGGQLNPAVTFGLWLARKISTVQAGFNAVAQILGATVGSLLAKVAIGGAITSGIPSLSTGISTTQGLVVEATLTFILVFVVFGTGVDARFGAKLGGMAIGLTVALDILAGGPITGGAMNTARWLGPAIAQGAFPDPVVYLVGPLIGAAVASILWSKVFLAQESSDVDA
jgi:aquaporin Z